MPQNTHSAPKVFEKPDMKIFFRFVAATAFLLVHTMALEAGPIKSALKLLEKGKFEKLEKRLQKMLQKDSVHTGARYVYSKLFVDSSYRHYSIDTAYIFIVQAIADYELEPTKHLKALHKDGVDRNLLLFQKQKIDSLAYARAIERHTVHAYQYFLDFFLDAEQRHLATEARNELAFQVAMDENTYESFLYFVQTYPDARQAKDATQFYDILLFQNKTADKKERSYRNFLLEYPESPYREKAEEQIMLIATADNQVSSYQKFLEDYPQSIWAHRIRQLLFYCFDRKGQSERFMLDYAHETMADSLQKVLSLRKGFLVPILEKDQFGFMHQDGRVLIKPQYEEIDEDLLCGQITQEVIIVRQEDTQRIINREGKEFFKGIFDEVTVEEHGLLKLRIHKKWGLRHLLGFQVLAINFQQIAILPDLVIAQQQGLWGVYSIQGRPLIGHDFDSIWMEGAMLVFLKNGQLAIAQTEEIHAWADGTAFVPLWKWNELEPADKGYYFAYHAQHEMALLDENGIEKIPVANQQINKINHSWLIGTPTGQTLLDLNFKPTFIHKVQKVLWNKSFLAIKKENKWGLNVPSLSWFPEYKFDSIALLNDYWALTFFKDSTQIYFSSGQVVAFHSSERLRLRVPSSAVAHDQQWSAFMEITNDKGFKKIYNHFGKLVLSIQQEEASYLGHSVIAIDKKGKKALYDSAGQLLLQPKYEAIGNYQSGTVALLGNRQFGLYHLQTKKTIPMEYDRLIKSYSSSVFMAGKEGKLGLINLDNKRITDFSFDEVVFWTDSIALTRQGEAWTWTNIYSGATLYGPVQEYKPVLWLENEKLAKVYKEGGYGIYSSTKGEIVAPTYNDLLNLGSPEQPLYFAEKHVTEADFFVVLYLDAQGNTLRKQVFTPEEYDLIYCD